MNKGEMFSKNRNSACFPVSTVLNFIWGAAQLTHLVAKIQGKKKMATLTLSQKLR